MKKLTSLIMVLSGCIFFMCNILAQPSSTYDSDAEGFIPYNNGAATLTYNSSGGNPGGYISDVDETWDIWYFRSTSGTEWEGNLSSYYGCDLYFEEKATKSGLCGPHYPTFEDIALIRGSDGAKICYWTSYDPGSTWTSYTIPLTESGWKWTDNTGASVSATDFTNFLSDIKNIRIRADYFFCNETVGLDNTMIVCASILPVELSTFAAIDNQNNTSLIEWETLSEKSCRGFQIEKTIAGNVFDSIGYLPGKGISNSSTLYTYTDNNFLEPCYYRLKQIDESGLSTYTDPIYLEKSGIYSETQSNDIEIFPNPANNILQIISNDAIGIIKILNYLGQVVFTDEVNTNSINMNVTNIPNGFYTAQIIHNYQIREFNFEVVK